MPIILQNYLNSNSDLDLISSWAKNRKLDVTPTYLWFVNWINDPKFRKKLQQNISKYGIYQEPRSNKASISTDVDALINSMKNNALWAKDNFKLGLGKYMYGMYEFDPSGKKAAVYINPAAIVNPGNCTEDGILIYGNPNVLREVTEEFGHSMEMMPLIEAVRQIYNEQSKKGLGYKLSDSYDYEYLSDPDELYLSLMRLRRDSGLKPGLNIDKEWIKKNYEHIKNNRLHYLPAETIIRLNNEVAVNNSNNSSITPLYARNGTKLIKKYNKPDS